MTGVRLTGLCHASAMLTETSIASTIITEQGGP
jgi:hypothetical protein